MRKMDSGDRDGGNNKERRKADALKVDEECTVLCCFLVVSDSFQVTPWQAFVPHLSQINGLSRDFSPFL